MQTKEIGSGKWFDEFMMAKMEGKKKYKYDFLRKRLDEFEQKKREEGELWKWQLGFWVFVLFGSLFLFASKDVLVSLCGFIPLAMGVGYLYLKFQKMETVEGAEEEGSMYHFLNHIGVLKARPGEFKDFGLWHVYYNGYSDDKEQLRFNVICKEQGVNLSSHYKTIEQEAPKYDGWPERRIPEQVWCRQVDGRTHEIILDFRKPSQNTSEIIDFLQQGNGLEPWELPRNEETGAPNGRIALGAIDNGKRYGKPDWGYLYERHFGVSGISGFGKSNAIHFLIWQLSQYPNVQIVYIDPNETDGALWEERAIVVGRQGVDGALDNIQKEIDRRTAIMKKNGWKSWHPSENLPQLVVVIDELKYLRSVDKDAAKKIENYLAIGRKYGVSFILGTQYPKKEYVGGCWENLHFRLSSRLNNDMETQVVFGPNAALAPCAKIEARGIFFVQDDNNKIERVHVPYVSEDIVKDMAIRTASLKNDRLVPSFAVSARTERGTGSARKRRF